MGAQGTATLDFGAFPGKSDASVDVATAGVVSSSLVEAWMHGGTATADHSIDEHMVETIKVWGKFLSAGNIRIYGLNSNQINEPDSQKPKAANVADKKEASGKTSQPKGTRIYGLWTVAWVWN